MRSILIVLPLYVAGAASASESIVDTAFVAEAVKRGAIVWDACAAGDYAQVRLRGAVNEWNRCAVRI